MKTRRNTDTNITGFLLLLVSPNDLDVGPSAEGAPVNGNAVDEVVSPPQASADEAPGLPVEPVEGVGIKGAELGDRIQVGDVFGDVYKIDVITTTVWEIGAPFRQGFVMAEQPTGRLVTFPNNEILSGSIVNLTRDFPYVWDELNQPVYKNRIIPVYPRQQIQLLDESGIPRAGGWDAIRYTEKTEP